MSEYWQVDQLQLGVVPVEAVALAVLLEQLQLRHPVQLAGAQHRVALEPVEHRLPAGEHVDGLRRRRRRRTGPRRTSCARSRYSSCSWTPVSFRPSCSVTVCFSVGSCEIARSPATGPSTLRSAVMNRSSIIASTSAVVPTLRYVDTSDRLASPMITCSRRYRSGSACGSSRVLMIGRFSVVSRPTSTSKKSARWLTWKPCSRPSCPIPTRPAPHDHLAADEERRQVPDDVAERRRAPHQVVLVGAVRRALVVGVVLVEHDRRPAGQLAGAALRRRASPAPPPCPSGRRRAGW